MPVPRASRKRNVQGPAARPSARALHIPASRIDASAAAANGKAAAPARVTAATVWFDYTDLINYFNDNRVPTGIQRVQIGMFRASLAGEKDAQACGRVAACSFDVVRRCWVALPETLFASVCRAACHAGSASGEDEAWRALVATLHQTISQNPPAPFCAGDVLVNIGSSWWIPDYMRYVEHLQRERGVLYAPYVHDCIPLRVPETCSADLVAEFHDWFSEAMRLADIILANSEHTGRDIAALAPTVTDRPALPHVVRLDARFDDGPQHGHAATDRMDALAQARLGIEGPFVLFVATVEARKNHLFVFRCWEQLIERHGADAVPDLICVGKQGWLVQYTLNWLRVHPGLARKIRLVGTISDLELAALYRAALFTAYCSLYEGWGLPVTESLCHGRVPIVPRHSSLPEAGGPFALYYDVEQPESFIEQTRRLLDAAERKRLEARIRAEYRPRAWPAVLQELLATVRNLASYRPGSGRTPPLLAGRVYGLARRPQPASANGNANAAAIRTLPGQTLKHGVGWHAAEAWGCWSSHPQAQVLFTPPSVPVDTLYLIVRGGPARQSLDICAGDAALRGIELQPHERRLLRLPLDHAAAAEVLVTFTAAPYELAPFTEGNDQRRIGFGLEALAVVDRSDAIGRADILEYMVTGS